MMNNDRGYFIVGIFVLAFVLFNFPFLGIFGRGKELAGVPLLFWYFFSAWILVIVGIVIVSYDSKRKL